MNPRIRQTAVFGLAGLLALAAPSLLQAAERGDGNPDHGFAAKAAESGMAEVDFGRMAAANASDPDVRAYGEKMVTDHTRVGDRLKAIAATKGMTLPAALDGEAAKTREELSMTSGAQFDKKYMLHMVMDHRKAIAAFEKEAASGKDADLKKFAADTLPVLREHLKMAETTAAKVGAAEK